MPQEVTAEKYVPKETFANGFSPESIATVVVNRNIETPEPTVTKKAIDQSLDDIRSGLDPALQGPLLAKENKYAGVGVQEQRGKIIKEIKGTESMSGKMAVKAAVSGGVVLKQLNTAEVRAGSIAKLLHNGGEGLNIMKSKAADAASKETLNTLLEKLFSNKPFTQDDVNAFMKFSPTSKDFK